MPGITAWPELWKPSIIVQAECHRHYCLPGGITHPEFDILARIITAEADNQDYKTKVAVGAVVLNRVKSPLFPDSIRGVVYQVDETGRYQFEPVLNGRFFLLRHMYIFILTG